MKEHLWRLRIKSSHHHIELYNLKIKTKKTGLAILPTRSFFVAKCKNLCYYGGKVNLFFNNSADGLFFPDLTKVELCRKIGKDVKK